MSLDGTSGQRKPNDVYCLDVEEIIDLQRVLETGSEFLIEADAVEIASRNSDLISIQPCSLKHRCGGVEKIGAKIVEEAAEVVEAAREMSDPSGREHVVHEAVDLIYHLFVLLGHQDIAISEIEAEVARRFGVSGLDEKAARQETKED